MIKLQDKTLEELEDLLCNVYVSQADTKTKEDAINDINDEIKKRHEIQNALCESGEYKAEELS